MNLSTRLAMAMIALVILTALAVGLLSYRNAEVVILPRALDRIDLRTELIAARLQASVQGLRADVLGFRYAVALDGMIRAELNGGSDPIGGTSFAQWRDRMATRFKAELAAKPLYAQFRVIGIADGGRELLRVDRSGPGGAIRMVPDAELQPKGDAPYFAQTIALPDGQAYVSPVELNREHGIVETPHTPVLRAAAPLFAPDGRRFGIVIINLDLRPEFDAIRAARFNGRVFVVNERGDYLLHPDSAREFGFEFGRPARLQDDLPQLDGTLAVEHSQAAVIADRNGAKFGVGVATVRLAQGPRVSVIQAIPNDDVIAAARTIRNSSLLAGLIAVLGAVIVAVWLARSMTRPLVQITAAVENYAPGATMVLPTATGGELGVLARAFARMSSAVSTNTATIRRNAEIFDNIMNSMVDMAVLLDESGRVVYANPAARQFMGIAAQADPAEAYLRLQVFQADGVTPFPRGQRPFRRIIGGEEIDNLEVTYCPPGGKSIKAVLSGRPIRDEAGAPKGAVMIARDVTEAKAIEGQLRQAQRLDAIGQLTGGVAHDFNNILTVITGTGELLAEAVADNPQLLAFAKTIDIAATRGAELTRQLLAFARRQPLQPVETDVNALLVDTAKLLRPTLGEQIEIEAMLEDGAWPALVDPSQLSAALLNLAVNARDAMPEGGKLTLETGNVILDEAYAHSNPEVKPGPYVMVAVSDTGAGIPAAIHDKIFEPFFTTKQLGRGTGLGLSMVYGFVKQSEGHIKVYSEEGHGTTIKLYLPRSAAQAVTSEASPPAAVPGGHETILVVEDDAMVRAHVIALLASLGYRTLAAEDGQKALAMVDAGAEFDLLFTDVIMPGGMNGRQLADAIRQRRPGLNVLYTSGYAENAIVHHGRLDPGVALLNKPYRKTDLAEKLRQVLAAAPREAT